MHKTDADVLDSKYDDVEFGTSKNYAAADKEWKHFETYKIKRHCPFVEVKKAKTLEEGNCKILVCPVDIKRENLPSGKNIADSPHEDNDWLGPLHGISPLFPLQNILPPFRCFPNQLRTNLIFFASEKSTPPPLPL